MKAFLLLVYVAASYWAVGQTFLREPLFGNWRTVQAQRFLCAIFLGWFIIPIVIVKHFGKK